MSDSWFSLENHAGEPIQAGEMELIPVSQAARLQIPGLPLNLIWNRPVSVIARREDGAQTTLLVHDYTRRAQLILLGIGLLGSWLAWLSFGRRRRGR
jgi:hypothetical protein